MRIEVFKSFHEVKSVWENFEKSAEMYAFQCYEWISSWYDLIGKKESIKPYIVVVKNVDDEIQLILPLGIKKYGFIKCLVWLGGNVTDYHCPAVSEKYKKISIDIAEIINYLKNTLPNFDVIVFEKQPEVIGNIKNPFILAKCKPYHENSYLIILENDWEKFYSKQVKSRIRSDTRRQQRRLAEKGELKFLIAEDESERNKITETMIKQKSRRYNETYNFNIFNNKNFRDFYYVLSQDKDNKKLKVHISALYLNGEIIATHWGLVDKKRFFYLMPTYAGGELAKYSPGRLLLIDLLKWCYRNDMKIFDFTIGGEAYKRDWCNFELKLFKYIKPVTIWGIIYKIYDSTVEYIRKNRHLNLTASKVRKAYYSFGKPKISSF